MVERFHGSCMWILPIVDVQFHNLWVFYKSSFWTSLDPKLKLLGVGPMVFLSNTTPFMYGSKSSGELDNGKCNSQIL